VGQAIWNAQLAFQLSQLFRFQALEIETLCASNFDHGHLILADQLSDPFQVFQIHHSSIDSGHGTKGFRVFTILRHNISSRREGTGPKKQVRSRRWLPATIRAIW